MLQLAGVDWVKVLSVTDGPDGLSSLRCNDTVGGHLAGHAVLGVHALRCYTTISIPLGANNAPAAGVTLTGNNLRSTIPVGTGWLTKTPATLNLALFAFTNGTNK